LFVSFVYRFFVRFAILIDRSIDLDHVLSINANRYFAIDCKYNVNPLEVNLIRLDVCSLSYFYDELLKMERDCYSLCKFNLHLDLFTFVLLNIQGTFLEHSYIKLCMLFQCFPIIETHLLRNNENIFYIIEFQYL